MSLLVSEGGDLMSLLLYRLGSLAFRAKWWVIVAWLLLMALVSGLAGAFGDDFDNTFRLPGTQSQEALDQLDITFPEAAGGSARIVVAIDGDVRDQTVRDQIARTVDRLEAMPFVDTVTDPYDDRVTGLISENGRALILNAGLQGDTQNFSDANRERLLKTGEDLQAELGDGAQVAVGGDVFGNGPPSLSPIEGVGLAIALVVLVLTLGSFVAALVPLITAVVGVAVSMALLVVAAGLVPINSSTPLLGVMLGLAVGIDYALFILSRHREQLAAGLDPLESAARAVATSGSAVVFAGLTVVIALVGLTLANVPFLATMGLAAAFTVAVAVLIALTALPAVMGILGARMRPRTRASADPDAPADPTQHRFFGGWVRAVTRRPVVTILIVIAVLGALSYPAKDLRLALPDSGQDAVGTPSRVTYDLAAEHFGPGFNGPLIVTVGLVADNDPLALMDDLKRDIEKMPGVARVPVSTPNRGADTGIIQVVPTTGPSDPATADLVDRLRQRNDEWRDRYDVDTAVTGITAVGIDISDRLGRAMIPFGVFVVGLSLVLLAMVFRSILVPLKATLGYLLSVGAAFGATSLVFVHGWFASFINLHHTGPVISFLPIILMGILFGLAMDYEVFLVSRMREDYIHGRSARDAVVSGFVGSGRVVLAAAVIMISVFAFFVPHGTPEMKAIAFGLTVGVAVDAFVVRMTLVPAVMTLLGDRAWWLPRRLAHRLPSFDVEGEALHHELSMAGWPGTDDVVYGEAMTVRSGQRTLLDRLDLRVPPGQIIVVEGDRLSRSALLLTLTGRLRLDDGQARVAGLLLPERASGVRRHSAVVDLAAPGPHPLARLVSAPPTVTAIDGCSAATLSRQVRGHLQELAAGTTRDGKVLLLGADDATDLADTASGHRVLTLRAGVAVPETLTVGSS